MKIRGTKAWIKRPADGVESIDMKDGSYFTYTYQDGYLLSQKHHPAGGSRPISCHYGYGKETASAYDKLTLVKDAEGNPYRISYDKKKAAKAVYPSGETLNLNYENAKTTVERTSGIDFNENTRRFKTPFFLNESNSKSCLYRLCYGAEQRLTDKKGEYC